MRVWLLLQPESKAGVENALGSIGKAEQTCSGQTLVVKECFLAIQDCKARVLASAHVQAMINLLSVFYTYTSLWCPFSSSTGGFGGKNQIFLRKVNHT